MPIKSRTDRPLFNLPRRSQFGISIALLLFCLVSACQSHLPSIDATPSSSPPKTTDVIDHVQCELAQIVNSPGGKSDNARLTSRMADDHALATLLDNLVAYNFVATAQISLEVTDAEGIAPSLSFMNALMTHVGTIGGQWNGTQDRSVTVNYSIDLARLRAPTGTDYRTLFCANNAHHSGIRGDLGLADIVADGLTALQESSSYNVYGSSGPSPVAVDKRLNQAGSITAPKGGSQPALNVNVDSLTGNILLAPQSAGTQTQGTVTLTGIATLTAGGKSSKYIVNWTGSIIPPDSVAGHTYYFSLSGSLIPASDQSLTSTTTGLWGFSPTINATGTINDSLQVASLTLSGVLVPAAGSTYANDKNAPAISVTLDRANPPHATPSSPASSVKGGSSTGGSGGTSFGSVVDFMLVYGANGSESYAFKNVKGISGTSPLLNAMRTNTDSLAITFVATCQKSDRITLINPDSYWNSIGLCDQFGFAQDQARSIGYQNNSLMFLRNFLVRP